MPTRNEWLALAERCERAEGPDRELDAALSKAANLYVYDAFEDADGCSKTFRDAEVKPLTSSIDAAVAVVEARYGERIITRSVSFAFNGCPYHVDILLAGPEDEERPDLPLTGQLHIFGQARANDACAVMNWYCRARAEEETPMTISDAAVEAACQQYIDRARDDWPNAPIAVQNSQRMLMRLALQAALEVMKAESQLVMTNYAPRTHEGDRL